MVDKKRVIAYYNGSNFYHALKSNYGITNVNFLEITNQTIEESCSFCKGIETIYELMTFFICNKS